MGEGGRYDDLVVKFRVPGHGAALPAAIGVRFAIDKLAEATLVSHHRRKSPTLVTPPSDVLVCSVGTGRDELLQQRLAVARMLWACRVSVR